jgi:GAF domain-containing protein
VTYPKTADDEDRVSFLRSLSILDTAPDESLSRIVRLCRLIFDVPASNISLVDGDRQWFKAFDGIDACETDREVAFCNYTILGREIFEVCDALEDPTFKDNPLVVGPPYQRYYAGAPIIYDDVRLGALCLIDFSPRPPLTSIQRQILTDLADMVVREIKM